MANIYCVIGNGNTRKSSLIRCLTGAGRSGVFLVEMTGAPIDILVFLSSPQEAVILPDELHDRITQAKVNHVLVPLWLRSRNATNPRTWRKVQLPNAVGYLNYLMSQGHHIMRPVILFQGLAPNGFTLNTNNPVPNHFLINSTITNANNEMRERIKLIWTWH